MNAIAAAALVDDLYREAVVSPGSVDDGFLAEWMEQALEAAGYDRSVTRPLRAAVRNARRIAARIGPTPKPFPDWRNGVDEVLATRGWEPQLDLVRLGLETAPTPELFAAVRERHRAVHFTEWMEGVGFEEWKARLTADS